MFVDRCGDGAEADFRRRLNLAEEAGLSVYCYSSVTGVKAWISREVGDEERSAALPLSIKLSLLGKAAAQLAYWSRSRRLSLQLPSTHQPQFLNVKAIVLL
jgi:hypothetical protein